MESRTYSYMPMQKSTHPFSSQCARSDGYRVMGGYYDCCIYIISPCRQSPTSNGDIRTRLLDQSQRRFDLNTSPELRRFILGSHLRLRLVDYFTTSTTLQHQYFSIIEATIAARYNN